MKNKLIDLEIRITHQEDTLQKLDQVVYQQQQLIDQLTQKIQQLETRLQAMAVSDILNPADDVPPPHY